MPFEDKIITHFNYNFILTLLIFSLGFICVDKRYGCK